MMPSLELNIAGRPLKIQCSEDNQEVVKQIATEISSLIDLEKRESVPFLTSTFIAFLKSMENKFNEEKILKETLNTKLFYENQIQKLEEEKRDLKQIVDSILLKLNSELSSE
ncbi:MAG: hypothetical protein CMI90_00495 [Pelagibacteraceae bacterium]|nr:hypothetical protein [Pelagibacteraceae bacterium]